MVLLASATLNATQLLRYRSLFVGRQSDFAIQCDNGRYRRAGRILTDKDLLAHFRGLWTLGSYVMDEHGRCRSAIFDADSPGGLEVLFTLQHRLADDGYPSYLELSRRQGHLRLFFSRPLLASQVRDWFLPYCPDGIEFYPKQNESGGYGSLMRLPYGLHRLSGERYPFVHGDETAYIPYTSGGLSDHLSWLEQVKRIPVPTSRLKPVAVKADTVQTTHQSLATPLRHLSYSTTTIQSWCALQDSRAVIGRFVRLNAQGLGCCPFGGHHHAGKDTHPSLKVYDPKYVGGSSWYCYTWNQGGNVFDFLCHWYNVDAATMWRRIQNGEH